MSQSITPTSPALPGVVRQCGVVALTNALAAEPYATAAGGTTIDFSTIFSAGLGGLTYQKAIQPSDVVFIYGRTDDGYTAVFTKAAGTNAWTFRLFTSGNSEIADGNLTKTLRIVLFIAGGGYN